MAARAKIAEFELANRIYAGATVEVLKASDATLAPLYAGLTGSTQLSNPQRLDSSGHFVQPVYIEDSFYCEISGLSVPTHVTSVSPQPSTFSLQNLSSPVVSSIAALKALAGVALVGAVFALGYYGAGDTGGGVYYWNSTDIRADNSGTVLRPTSDPTTGRWNLKATEVSVGQFGAKGTATSPSDYVGAVGFDDTDAIEAAYAGAGGRTITFPFVPGSQGIYKQTRPLACANNQKIIGDPAVAIWYDDTLHPGTFCLTNGTAGVRGGGLHMVNLRIEIRTGTGGGLKLLNSVYSTFDDCYISGTLTPGWDAASNAARIAAMSGRTSIGLQIVNSGAECFQNKFWGLRVIHCHTLIDFPAGNTVTQNFFYGTFLFNDSLYGDQTGKGVRAQNGQNAIFDGGYAEACDDGVGASFSFEGSGGSGYKVRDFIFDPSPDANNLYGGGTIAMNAISCTILSADYPGNNSVTGGEYAPTGCSIVDNAPASKGNYWQNNPSSPGVAFTTTLRDAGGGTINLTPGKGGDQMYIATSGGRDIEYWGLFVVLSVSGAPSGRTFLKLPRLSMNDNGNYSPPTISGSGFTAGAVGLSLGGSVDRNTDEVEIWFSTGQAKVTNTSSLLQAGAFFEIRGRYTAKELV